MRVIPNGVPCEFGQPTRKREDVRLELGCQSDELCALVVAGARPEKRLDVFIHAIARARANGARVKGYVAGDGRLLPELVSLATRTKSGVTFLGRRSDIPDLLHAANVVCLTSTHEAHPMILLEAAAARRPAIASNVGGVREIVGESTGFLVAPGDVESIAHALRELARNPRAAASLGANAFDVFSRKFTADVMTSRYHELFVSLNENGP